MKTTLRATVSDVKGVKSLHFNSAAFLRHAISKFKEGKVVWVTIDDRAPKRSELQHRFYFLCLTAIEESTGMDKDDLHLFFKEKFLEKKKLRLKGEEVAVPPSTTTLTKAEFVEYMMQIAAFVGTMGIVLPDPAEWYAGSPEK